MTRDEAIVAARNALIQKRVKLSRADPVKVEENVKLCRTHRARGWVIEFELEAKGSIDEPFILVEVYEPSGEINVLPTHLTFVR